MGKNKKMQQNSSRLIRNISLNAYRSSTMSSFIIFWKKPNWCLYFIHSRVLPGRRFSSWESTMSYSITGKSMSVSSFDLTTNERMNRLACWMKHVGWHLQTIYTFIQYSPNSYPTFHPACWIKCWVGLTRSLPQSL